MKTYFLSIAFALCTWLSVASTDASIRIKVTGSVSDQKGQPLVGATVKAIESFQGTTADSQGNFELLLSRRGSYRVTASFIGYQSVTQEINADEQNHLNFVLPEQTIMGEEVIVHGTRASGRMPIAYTNLNTEEIRSLNMGADIPFLLELTPSVVAVAEGGSGVGYTSFRIRGSDMTRINITVNGIPLNDSESQGVWWVNMPDFVSSVDNVQVQRGVGTSTNGPAAFGATVNFQTSSLTPEPFALAETMIGSYNTLRTTLRAGTGLVNDRFSFEGRYSSVNSDGYIDRAFSNHESMFLTGAWHTPNSILRLNMLHGDQRTGITWEGNPGDLVDSLPTYNPAGYMFTDDNGVPQYYSNETDNYTQTHYHLIYGHQLGRALSLKMAAHWTIGKGYYEQFKVDEELGDYGLMPIKLADSIFTNTDLVRQKWLDNDFYGASLNLTYRLQRVEAILGGGWNRYDGYHFGNILWTSINAGIPKDHEWYRNRGVKDDMNVFGKIIWQATPSLAAFADVQGRSIAYDLSGLDDDTLSLDQSHQWTFVNPKAGATYSLNASNEVFASLAIANREPTRADIKDAMKFDTKETPRHETLANLEVGYTFRSPGAAIGVNLYYMQYRDQLVHTGKLSSVGYPLMTNVPNSFRRGVELSGALRPVKWFRWDANLTLSQNIIEDFTDFVEHYDENDEKWEYIGQLENNLGRTNISFSPSVIGSSLVRFEPLRDLGVSFISKYVGSQYFDNTSNPSRMLDAYFVQDLRLDYKLKLTGIKGVNLQLAVNNVLNNHYVANAWVWRAVVDGQDGEYREDGFYPQAGINFMLRVGVEF